MPTAMARLFMHSDDPGGCPRHKVRFSKRCCEFECSCMCKCIAVYIVCIISNENMEAFEKKSETLQCSLLISSNPYLHEIHQTSRLIEGKMDR